MVRGRRTPHLKIFRLDTVIYGAVTFLATVRLIKLADDERRLIFRRRVPTLEKVSTWSII